MKFIFACTLGLFLNLSGIADAQTTQDHQEFRDAVELWLTGNDADSLTQLAILARNGHTDARLLLARIEITDRGPSPWRASLTPQQSRDLFRVSADGPGLQPTWLTIEARAGNALAIALLKSRLPDVDPDLIRLLHRIGEAQASDHPTRILALYGDQKAKLELLASDYLLTDLRPYLAYLMDEPEPRGDGLAALRWIAGPQGNAVAPDDPEALEMAGVLAMGFGFGDPKASNLWHQPVADWLSHSDAARPIAGLCRAECPGEVNQCSFTMMVLTGGYFETIRLDSPLETVIPQNLFLSSPRARIMALRRAALTRAETFAELASTSEIAALSSCAARLIGEERLKY